MIEIGFIDIGGNRYRGVDRPDGADDATWSGIKRIVDELWGYGYIRATCMIRDLNKIASRYNVLGRYARDHQRSDIVEHCDDKRGEVLGVRDWLYEVVNMLWPDEEPLGSSACDPYRNTELDSPVNLGSLGSMPISTIVIIVAAILAAGGVAMYISSTIADTVRLTRILGYCKGRNLTPEECIKTLDVAAEGGTTKALNKAIAVVGTVAVGFGALKLLEIWRNR